MSVCSQAFILARITFINYQKRHTNTHTASDTETQKTKENWNDLPIYVPGAACIHHQWCVFVYRKAAVFAFLSPVCVCTLVKMPGEYFNMFRLPTFTYSVKYWRSFPYNSHIPLFFTACILSLCWKNTYTLIIVIFIEHFVSTSHVLTILSCGWVRKVYKVYTCHIHNARTRKTGDSKHTSARVTYFPSPDTLATYTERRHQLGKAQILKYSTCSVLTQVLPGKVVLSLLDFKFIFYIFFCIFLYNIYNFVHLIFSGQ